MIDQTADRQTARGRRRAVEHARRIGARTGAEQCAQLKLGEVQLGGGCSGQAG